MKVAVEQALKEAVDFSERNRLVLCHRRAPRIVDCRPADSPVAGFLQPIVDQRRNANVAKPAEK
jgi:hypothetical protein